LWELRAVKAVPGLRAWVQPEAVARVLRVPRELQVPEVVRVQLAWLQQAVGPGLQVWQAVLVPEVVRVLPVQPVR
jgi:hypothetical protein